MIKILNGEDNFRRQLALDLLRAKLVDPAWESMNLVQLDKPSITEVIEAANMPAFGLCERLVVANDAEFLTKKQEEDDVSRLLEGLGDLPEGVTLVFNSSKILGTLKLVKQLKKIAELEDFKEFSPWDTKQAASWLQALAKEKKISVDFQVLEFMVEYLGSDSSKLYTELNRVSLRVAGEKVTEDLIKRECKAKHDVFKFAEELAKNNKESARFELEKIIRNGEANIGFLMGLQTNLSRYLKLKLMAKTRMSRDEQAKKLGVTSGRLYFLEKSVSGMQLPKLEMINDNLAKIEAQVKRGQRSVDFALRLLVQT